MKARTFRYIFPQALRSLIINGWMTFAAILTITISLFLCVFFWLLVINIDANATEIESEVEIVAYIKEGIAKTDYAKIKSSIQALPGFAGITFISKEEGLTKISPRFGNEKDLLSTLGGVNPLPDSFSIKATKPEDVSILAEKVGKIKGIDSVRYGSGTVDKLFTFTDTMRKVGLAIMLLMAIAAVMLVAMTTRLTVYARRKEIMVMKWVGATNWFIRWPFLLEGIILGVIGSVLAVSLALLVYYNAGDYLASTVSFMVFVDIKTIWQPVALFTVLSGVVMGAVGSVISMAKFLDV